MCTVAASLSVNPNVVRRPSRQPRALSRNLGADGVERGVSGLYAGDPL